MPVIQLVIRVDGSADDAYDLLLSLKESVPLSGAAFDVSSSPGSLGAVDTILASISTAAALASLAISIVQWRQQSSSAIVVQLEDGRPVSLETGERQRIEKTWEQLNSDDEGK